LTAAYRLQQAGHRVEVLEALDIVGGRTHAEHFGPGHHCDTGAGWLATFYTHTLALFDELGYRDLFLQPRNVRGAADLLIDGQLYPWPFRGESVFTSELLTSADKSNWMAYLDRLMADQPAGFQPDLACDYDDALAEFLPLGDRIVEVMMRSLFEGPFFTRLDTLSAAMVRKWLAAVQEAQFFQVKGGMDAPWLRLAQQLRIHTAHQVDALHTDAQTIVLRGSFGERRYDGVVLAVPAPAAHRILAGAPEFAPPWLGEVYYGPQVRVYAARQSAQEAKFGVHILPPTTLFSVEYYSGRYGAWGACPPDWQWGLMCTYGATCAPFLDLPAQEATYTLWDEGRRIYPDLFALEQAEVVHLHRWRWAVPIMAPGHYRRLAEWRNRPPVVFAGDWMNEACVEGAVRSGEAAAAAFSE
jgi:protoporphyrinogen oxidase